MLIPRIRPGQIKNEPDQVTAILNQVIDYINSIKDK